MQVTLVECHLRHCNDAEKNPEKSSSHTDLTSKSSQSFFKIMDQFGVNHGNCLIEYDVELCDFPILELSTNTNTVGWLGFNFLPNCMFMLSWQLNPGGVFSLE